MKNASKRLVLSIEELGRMYDFLNKEFFESALSKPVITIMPDERKGHGGMILDWFTQHKVWREETGERAYELNVTADYANRPLLEIAETHLREMARQYARENNIDDCSRAGTYHNKNFAEIATQYGLRVTKSDKNGFSLTQLTDDAKKIIYNFEFGESLIYRRQTLSPEEVLDLLDKQVPKDTPDRDKVIENYYNGLQDGKYTIGSDGIKPKKSSTRKYICPRCGMNVSATKVVNIKCGDCNETMQCVSHESQENNADTLSA